MTLYTDDTDFTELHGLFVFWSRTLCVQPSVQNLEILQSE